MTASEKNAQIGAAVTEYQTAKSELGHIEARIESAFEAYREIGNTMDRRNRTPEEPRLVEGKIVFGWHTGKYTATDLLDEAALRELIVERDNARQRFDQAKAAMQRLGVIGVS